MALPVDSVRSSFITVGGDASNFVRVILEVTPDGFGAWRGITRLLFLRNVRIAAVELAAVKSLVKFTVSVTTGPVEGVLTRLTATDSGAAEKLGIVRL